MSTLTIAEKVDRDCVGWDINFLAQEEPLLEIDQDWQNETTTYTFVDGSSLVVTPFDWEVK